MEGMVVWLLTTLGRRGGRQAVDSQHSRVESCQGHDGGTCLGPGVGMYMEDSPLEEVTGTCK